MESDWRLDLLTGREQFHFAFHQGIFSDVKIIIDGINFSEADKEVLKSHSLVLKIRSSVFEKHLEKIQAVGGYKEISIQGFPHSAVKAFVQFLYTDELLSKSVPETIQVLHLAKKYKVSALVLKCTGELQEKLSVENASSIFQASRDLNQIELGRTAFNFILNHAANVFQTEDLTSLSQFNLQELLAEDLDIREIDLFKGVLNWAQVECKRHKLQPDSPRNIRLVLKDCVNQIRFPLMTKQEFETNVLPTGLLNEREVTEIQRYFDAEVENKKFVIPALFSVKPRMTAADSIDLENVDEESHKRLAKFAVEKSSSQGLIPEGNKSLTVSNVVVEIEPQDSSVNLDVLVEQIFRIRKYGLHWGASQKSASEKLFVSFAADDKRSYGVGSVIEDIQDGFPSMIGMTLARSFKDDIQVHLQ